MTKYQMGSITTKELPHPRKFTPDNITVLIHETLFHSEINVSYLSMIEKYKKNDY